jgi:hypothetical protein
MAIIVDKMADGMSDPDLTVDGVGAGDAGVAPTARLQATLAQHKTVRLRRGTLLDRPIP